MRRRTRLRRISDLEVSLQTDVAHVRVPATGWRFQGDHHTLAILDIFTRPRTIDDALELLEPRFKGRQACITISAQIAGLQQAGILEDADTTPALRSHPWQFDSPPAHIHMLNDRHRTLAFQEAIRRTVTSSDVVVDVGTGTGVLAATAAMAGARHVYAIERTGMAAVAEQVFAANGLADRVTVIDDVSTQVELPERADVMISELIGNDPLEEGVLRTTADALARLLKTDGRLVPRRLAIYGLPLAVPPAAVEAHVFTADLASRWQEWYGIDFSPLVAATRRQDHSLLHPTCEIGSWTALADPIRLLSLDLRTAQPRDVSATHPVRFGRSGTLSGILVYFELDLTDAIHLSTHPSVVSADSCWTGKVWLPGEPLAVEAGQTVTLTYRCGAEGQSTFVVSPA